MPPDLADRLAKVLRLICDRSNDGETLAAASRLSAIATAHGVNWDKAFSGNGHALSQADMQRIYSEGYERGLREGAASKPSTSDWTPAGKAGADEVGGRLEEVGRILEAAQRYQNDGLLESWYVQFSSDMRTRLEEWEERTFITEKQWKYINKLRSILERAEYLG